MKISHFNYFFIKYVCLKGINIEVNADSSASDIISVDSKYSSVNLFYKKYIVTIREFHL